MYNTTALPPLVSLSVELSSRYWLTVTRLLSLGYSRDDAELEAAYYESQGAC